MTFILVNLRFIMMVVVAAKYGFKLLIDNLLSMKKTYVLLVILCFIVQLTNAQETLDDLLKRYNTNDIPYISVQELAMPKTEVIIIDARALSEYNISHIKNAIHVGFNTFLLDAFAKQFPNKDKAIVVYCSLGIRSEIIANRLIKDGYTDVKNLYGGIFEWKNTNFSIYNFENKETDSIHAFSKAWSKWLKNGIKGFSKRHQSK